MRGTVLYEPAKLEIPDDQREWAKWGAEQGCFAVSYRRDAVMEIQLPQHSARARRPAERCFPEARCGGYGKLA